MLVPALLILAVVALLFRGAKDLDRIPVHGTYPDPPEGFLRGTIGSMAQVRASLLDPRGVLLFDYGGTLGRQYNPLFIADFAMALVPLQEDAEGRRILFENLSHLLESAVTTPAGHLAFPYRFEFSVVGQKAPWFSAMAQARVGQAMMWGWRLSGDPRYLEAGKAAVLALTDGAMEPPLAMPLAQGLWLKEFPGHHFNVLDGSLVALVGVREVWKGLPPDDPDRERLEHLFEEALTGFKANHGCFAPLLGGVYFNDAAKAPSQSYYDIIMTQLGYLSPVDDEVAAIAGRYSLDGMSPARRLGLAAWQHITRKLSKRGLIGPCVR